MKKKILFVCNYNEVRSRTAEIVYKEKYDVKSCGLKFNSRIRCDYYSFLWADLIIVMEKEQKNFIIKEYPEFKSKIRVLGINSNYHFMETELINKIKEKMKSLGL